MSLYAATLVWLCRLERREPEPTGFRWIRNVEVSDETESSRASLPRTSACAGISTLAGWPVQLSPVSKSGRGERRPSGR
jgi:hypothetical protein